MLYLIILTLFICPFSIHASEPKPKARSYYAMLTDAYASAIAFLSHIEHSLSFSKYAEEEWDDAVHEVFSPEFLQFTGYYQEESFAGIYNPNNEINACVRITLINGILNLKSDMDLALQLLSETHGNSTIHYVFRSTQGWSEDLFDCVSIKAGYTSTQACMLAATWKQLIYDLGGPGNEGIILHYAHSIGAIDTYAARELLSPEEQQMIHVITLGSPMMIPEDAGFGSVANYTSKRDGVSIFADPVGYFRGWLDDKSNVFLLGSIWGIPFVEHTLSATSYRELIEELGKEFASIYCEV